MDVNVKCLYIIKDQERIIQSNSRIGINRRLVPLTLLHLPQGIYYNKQC